MVRPSVPLWAVDPTFDAAAGIDPSAIGAPIRVEPTSSTKKQGDVPGLGYVAEHHNWLLGLIADNLNWLQGLVDIDGFFLYEEPKNRSKVYPLNHGWNPFERGASTLPGDWWKYDGKSIVSQVDDACFVVPLVGLPVGATISTVNVRVKTHNGEVGIGRSANARMEIIRYRYVRLLDLSDPLTYDTGPNPGWDVLSTPAPLDFPDTAAEVFAGTIDPFTVENGCEYAVRLWAGTDTIGGHHSDEFFGVAVDWIDPGPRSGG